MNRTDKALNYFRNNFNCAQSVFAVFGTGNGLEEDECLKIACPFGAGMGRQQMTCGAVTGALMAIGIKYGKAMNDPEEKKSEAYARTNEFFSAFKNLNASISCSELLDGLDMNDPADLQIIKDLGLFDTNCEKYIIDAVTITEKLIGTSAPPSEIRG